MANLAQILTLISKKIRALFTGSHQKTQTEAQWTPGPPCGKQEPSSDSEQKPSRNLPNDEVLETLVHEGKDVLPPLPKDGEVVFFMEQSSQPVTFRLKDPIGYVNERIKKANQLDENNE
jgi:hypothetical protein